jgi:hypothetical protein
VEVIRIAQKIKNRLQQKDGMSYPFIACLVLVLLIIMFGVVEVVRVNIIASNVRDKAQATIISETTSNYVMMYQPLRDGYAAPFQYSDSGWQQSSLTTRNRIQNTLTEHLNDGEHSQVVIESVDFSTLISNIAPSGSDPAVQFTVRGEVVVLIPHRFLWAELPPIRLTVEVNSTWRELF